MSSSEGNLAAYDGRRQTAPCPCEEQGPGSPAAPTELCVPAMEPGTMRLLEPLIGISSPESRSSLHSRALMNFSFQEEEEEVALPIVPKRPKET